MLVKLNSVHVVYDDECSRGPEPVAVILKAGRFPVLYRLEDMSADEVGDLIESKRVGDKIVAVKAEKS